MRRRAVLAALAVVGLALAADAAVAVGPWPGLARSVSPANGSLRYVAARVGSTTRLTEMRDGRVLRSASVAGSFGIPAVTVDGEAGGLSADGRTLVLAQPPAYESPRTLTRFVIVSTAALRPRTIALRGDFGYDALSPNGRLLYLIQHRALGDASYSVRAYDLRAGRLLPRVIADKRELETTMHGFPVARATSADGTWVYTLYRRSNAVPFVHALNARRAYALCIDLPRAVADQWIWSALLELTDRGAHLVVRLATNPQAFTIDTRTMRVVAT